MRQFVEWLFFTLEGLMVLAGTVIVLATTWVMRGGGGKHRR